MPRSYKTDLLVQLAKTGPIRARDLAAEGIPRTYLARMCDSGVFEQVGRGIYRLADARVTELHTIAEVCKRVPHAVICLLTALQVHALTTEAPHAIWIMIDTHARPPKLDYPRIELVRASGKARTHGIETRIIEGVPVNLTSAAKTVADCFRYRRHIGLDVAITALRAYLHEHRGPVDALTEAARADRIFSFMRPYIEALVS